MVKSLSYALRKYNAKRKNSHYIIGFIYDNNVYVWYTKRLPHDACYMDKGNIRMRFSLTYKATVTKYKTCFKRCTLDELVKYIDKAIKCNSLGEAFERMITEDYNQKWYKDYVPYYKGCDLEADGCGYSIKLAANCTIARQASLRG